MPASIPAHEPFRGAAGGRGPGQSSAIHPHESPKIRKDKEEAAAEIRSLNGEAVEQVTGKPRVTVSLFNDVEPKPISWLWHGLIAMGKLCVIAGPGGVGKGLITIDLAARVSRGEALPCNGGVAPKGKVLLMSAEDDEDDSTVHRLKASGADMSQVGYLTVPSYPDKPAEVITMERVDLSREALDQFTDCKLLVIDPVGAYYGAADSYKESDVRAMLRPLRDLARENELAIVLVAHLHKGKGSAAEKISGSVGLINAVRSGFMVAKSPADPSVRIMSTIKNNYGSDDWSLGYKTVPTGLDDGGGNEVYRVQWDDHLSTITAEELVNGRDSGPDRLGEAKDWIMAALADGPMLAARLKSLAVKAGISEWTYNQARKSLGTVSRPVQKSGAWMSALPGQEPAPVRKLAMNTDDADFALPIHEEVDPFDL